jgi:hypothetical protein
VQGLALRGHRDSGRVVVDEKPEINDGNFRALLRFRGKCDPTLKQILENSDGNAQYTSPIIQNQIIQECNDLILQNRVKEINSSSCFSILADEATDIACIEQLSLCIRYIDLKSCNLKENFLQFIPVNDVTGEGIATAIVNKLRSLKIDIKKLRGQGYDGAASMAGKLKGVQTHVREIVPSALYVHCSAHSLNLAVSTACDILTIRNCMRTIALLYEFLNTPKRHHVLETVIHEMKMCSTRREKLKKLCATRWLLRYDSVAALIELFDAVIETLQKISEWTDKDSSANANSLLCTVLNCQFVISLYCIHKVFVLTMPLCKFLQKPTVDLLEAVNLAEDISTEIKSLRDNASEEFSKIFTTASELLQKFGSSVKLPRQAARQTTPENVTTTTLETYFRVNIFIPFLDTFLNQLDSRFLMHRQILQGFQSIVPAVPSVLEPSQLEAFEHLTKFYEDDIVGEKDDLKSEITLWYKRLARISQGKPSPPKTAIEALAVCNKDIMPNIYKLLEILAVLPVSTCTSERSFSTLRRLKSYLRNSNSNTRLNGLALLNIHRNNTPTVEDILNELAKTSRRLDFAL